ncbi:hypothetical protein L198_08052 [Cryptococcus wingfieldii CBS 7118]|uniref:Uncharacterized protein n=1 Tax=Cryptococcus wingfieldii CBS 7118 TaxID=1295528 RepID=A0A1E3HJC7_9TREE|nr:hypothetical protein L198_08052 [Cryptococcus wingfieldii CBS 7118]ODN76457.1 hypothetical protein L198_08052 [Cryptococcus wingfieldii CBS 7118]
MYKFYPNDPTRAAYRQSENDLLPAEKELVSDFWHPPPLGRSPPPKPSSPSGRQPLRAYFDIEIKWTKPQEAALVAANLAASTRTTWTLHPTSTARLQQGPKWNGRMLKGDLRGWWGLMGLVREGAQGEPQEQGQDSRPLASSPPANPMRAMTVRLDLVEAAGQGAGVCAIDLTGINSDKEDG